MSYLGNLDYGIIVVYCLLLVGVGSYFSRIASRSLDHYFLGGKSLPWWMLGTSGMASCLDMAGTMLITSFLFIIGPRGLFIEFRGGVGLVLAFMMCWTGKWHRRSGCMTGAEWNAMRFGEDGWANAARILTALAAIVTAFGMLAYLIKGAGMFLSMFVPLSPFYCSLLMLGFGTFYTMFSGFYGVVITDFLQSIIILVATVSVAVLAYMSVGDFGSLQELATRVTGNAQWMGSTPSWHTSMPAGYEAYRFLFIAMCFYLLRNILSGAGSGADPKYFGARNERECGLLSFQWISLLMFRWPMMIGFAVLGLIAVNRFFPDQSVLTQAAALIKQYYPDATASGWAELISALSTHPEQAAPQLVAGLGQLMGSEWTHKLSLLSFQGTVNPENILPAVILHQIPAGLRGVIFVALVAAAVTTFGSTINSTSAFFVRDIYQRYLRPKAANRELILTSYCTCLALVAGGYVMAYSTRSINDIWGWIVMGLGSGLSMPMLLRLYWWRFNGAGFSVGLFVGLLGAVVQRLLFPELTEWNQFIILTGISLVGSIAGSYMAPPVELTSLTRFYRNTRPFGMWGRFKRALSPEQRAATTREHWADMISLPIVILWQVTLFLLPMQLVTHNTGAFWKTLPIWAACLAGIYFVWYRNLPPAQRSPDHAHEEESARGAEDDAVCGGALEGAEGVSAS